MRLAVSVLLVCTACPAAAQIRTQVYRPAICVAANDQVTSLRLGKDRQNNPTRLDVAKAVEVGNGFAAKCRSDGGFMIAYSIARIDLSGNPKYSKPAVRTALFNTAVADLESIRAMVNANTSDRYEIFSIMALIYYDTRQYEKVIAVSRESDRFAARMSAASRQKVLVTRGMAESQLGQSNAAAQSFDLAARAGHPQAAAIKRRMLGVK